MEDSGFGFGHNSRKAGWIANTQFAGWLVIWGIAARWIIRRTGRIEEYNRPGWASTNCT